MYLMAKRIGPDDPELPIDKEFGRRVTAARKARGWSQWDMDSSVDGDEVVAAAAGSLQRWQDAGRLIEQVAPVVFREMVAAIEVTAVALSTASRKNID